VLGRDVLIRELIGLRAGPLEHGGDGRAEARLDLTARENLRHPVEHGLHAVAESLGMHTELLEERVDDALGVRQQREQDVLELDLLMASGERLLVRPVQGRAGLEREFLHVHVSRHPRSARWSSRVIPYRA
jgi:hypothetical protein